MRKVFILLVFAAASLLPFFGFAEEKPAPADKPTQIDIDSLDGRRYQLALNRSMNDILACYSKELATHPGLQGKLELRVTIEKTGATRSVEARQDTLKNETVTKCIQDLLLAKTWPSHSESVYFDNIFNFTATKK